MPKRDRTWYQAMGVPDPEHKDHLSDEEIDRQLSEKRKHDWRQRGAVLFCVACPWEHGTQPIFTEHILQGTDANGMPILKKVSKS